MSNGLVQTIANGLLFNISWLAIVTSESAPIALAVVLAHLSIHMLWIGRGQRELMYIAGISVFGVLTDQFLFAVGIFTVNGATALAPLWLSCLWPVLASTMGHAFSGLQNRLVLAGLLGAIGGFASYQAGTGLTAVDYTDPVYGAVIVAALWAVSFPAMAVTARLSMASTEAEPRLA